MIHYKGYEIAESIGHGKAVKGTKRTATIQVRQPAYQDKAHKERRGYYLRAQVRFNVGDREGRKQAIEKAKAKADTLRRL